MHKVVSSVILLLGTLSGLPNPVAMQTNGDDATSSSPIGYSVALYIMIGIAVFYSMATLICCVLVVLNCCTRKNPHKRVTPYTAIPLPQRLETIMEESETSRCSSQISLSKHHKNEAMSFTNRSAVEKYEQETEMAEPKLPEDLDDKTERSLSFANRSALDLESGKVTEEELAVPEELPGRGSVITTSFRNVVPISKINGQSNTRPDTLKPSDSPLLRYTPRSTSIPPAEVKVPFSEPAPEERKMNLQEISQESPRRSRSKSSPTDAPSTPSPFHKRKHPENEIPSAEKSDLMKFRRKNSSESPLPGPLTKPRTTETSSQNERRNTSSPARSRPQPKHPVRSSPKQSPFIVRRATKDAVPNIAVHSKSSSKAPDTPKSSSSESSSVATVTAEALLKELQVVKKKWYIIGTQLHFPRRRLNIILNGNSNAADKCLAILCKEWVSSSKEATWNAVVDALRSDIVGERELASTLEQQYCWLESPNSKTWVR